MSIFKNIFIIFRAVCELFGFIEPRVWDCILWNLVELDARDMLAMFIDA